MFARHVTMKLKANSASEFTRAIENEILPLLSKQKGFRDEITFVAPERSEAIGNSLWDTKEDAEAYSRTGYPEVLKALSKVVEGTPKVETFEVANSTFHKIAAKAATQTG
jgi:heme-degrading monooxygenase HmoA